MICVLTITQINISFLFFKILLLYLPFVIIMSLKNIFIVIWKEHLLIQFEIFLNYIIAQIKMGSSFLTSFKLALKQIPTLSVNTKFQNHFTGILESILFSKPIPPDLLFSPLKQIIQELKKADQFTQCLEHLENLRHTIRVRAYFRRKVHTALIQVRVQAIVLTILYIGLFIFVLYQYGLQYIHILFASLFLFSLGLIILFQIGRKIKWNI